MQIVCIHCEAINRVPDDRPLNEAKCGKCANSLYQHHPVTLNDHNFFRFIEKTESPIIVDFWADWCAPCRNMAPVFSAVAAESQGIIFAKVDTQDAQQISAEAMIRSLPTLVFFNKGQEVNRVSGGLNASQMKAWVMECVRQL
jgi:thioredoxin 2